MINQKMFKQKVPGLKILDFPSKLPTWLKLEIGGGEESPWWSLRQQREPPPPSIHPCLPVYPVPAQPQVFSLMSLFSENNHLKHPLWFWTTNSLLSTFFGAASSAQAHIAMETKQKTPPWSPFFFFFFFPLLITSLFIATVGVVRQRLQSANHTASPRCSLHFFGLRSARWDLKARLGEEMAQFRERPLILTVWT